MLNLSHKQVLLLYIIFPGGSAGKESACKAGDPSSIPGSGKSPGEGIATPVFVGFPGSSDDKRISLQCRRPGFNPWVGKILGGGHGNPVQYSCLENPHGQRSLAGYSPRDRKELDTTEWLSIHMSIINIRTYKGSVGYSYIGALQ